MTTNPSIPQTAIDAGAKAFLANEPGTTTSSWGSYRKWTHHVVEAVLRAAAPHLLKEAHSAIEHLHNDVGTLTEQLNRARDVLQRIEQLGEQDEREYLTNAPFHHVVNLARVALRNLEAPSE